MNLKSSTLLHVDFESSTPPKADTALFVLVPTQLGGLQAYERLAAGPLREPVRIHNVEQLAARIRRRHHKTVVLCGTRFLDPVREAVLQTADLYVVPLAWLRGISRANPTEAAALAARLVTAQRTAPIRRFCRAEPIRFPF